MLEEKKKAVTVMKAGQTHYTHAQFEERIVIMCLHDDISSIAKNEEPVFFFFACQSLIKRLEGFPKVVC